MDAKQAYVVAAIGAALMIGALWIGSYYMAVLPFAHWAFTPAAMTAGFFVALGMFAFAAGIASAVTPKRR